MAQKLTKKQEKFVDEYLLDLNATQAAVRAGYSAATANQAGPRLLVNVGVQQEIAKGREKLSQKTQIDQAYVINTLFETVERCKQARPVLDKRGGPVLVETEDGQMVPAYTFDSSAVLKGCELIGKHLGFFEKDNAQLKSPDNVKWEIEVTHINHKDKPKDED